MAWKSLFAAPRAVASLVFVLAMNFFLPVLEAQSANVASDRDAASGSSATAPAAQQQQPYPDPKAEKGKLEGTLGAIKLRFYGMVLLNVSMSDSVQAGQDVPLWPIPGGALVTFPDGSTRRAGMIHDTIFTARQSVFGFTFRPATLPENAWRPSGVLEFDFFGSRPVDSLNPQGRVLNQPRLRKAYFQLEKADWKFVAGQDDMIISPLDPISLSHVGVPLGATAGDLWARLPQVRAELKHSFGETTTLFQIGLLRPLFADPRLNDLPAVGSSVDGTFSGFGERASAPFYQTRFAVSHPMAGSAVTIGVGGHFGSEAVGANRNVHSWAAAIDASIPLSSRVIFRGEGFVGSNLVPFQGGILQGVVARPATALPPAGPAFFTEIHPLGAAGGWFELTFRATADNKNNFYIGGGGDYPRNHQLLPGSNRSKNNFAWASYFRKLTNDVTLALEWSNWQFVTKNFTTAGRPGPKGPTGRGNVFNIALAYQF
jgi:hypothetical protein